MVVRSKTWCIRLAAIVGLLTASLAGSAGYRQTAAASPSCPAGGHQVAVSTAGELTAA